MSEMAPRRASVGDAVSAFFRRDITVSLSYSIPFVLELVALAFTVLTFRFVGQLISPGRVPGGYFAFVSVGLALSAFLDAGVVALGSNLRQEQVQGTLEATLAAGLPIPSLAAGMAAYPMVAAAVSALAYVALAGMLGADAPDANWTLGALSAVIGSVSFVGLGLVGAALVLVIRRAAAATGWLVAVLSLAGGEFFPPGLLPGWFEALANLSPFTQALRLARRAILGGLPWSDSWGSLAILALMAAAYLAVGIGTLSLGIRHAKRTGSIGQY